jgi:Bacterial Ig-like domain (group 3)/FG-GAP-like repeat
VNTFALFRNIPWKACLFTVLAVLGLIGQSANAQPQPIFPVATQVSLPVESTPLFFGDFNGDGVPDLAAYTVTSNAPPTLSILLSFATNTQTTVTTTLPSSSQASSITFADVNNDKKLDLVFYSNGYLTIQLGNGDGTFQSPAYFASNSFSPVLVDLNGDGYLDVAGLVASTQPNAPPQVAVFINGGSTGPGVFASPKLYAATQTVYNLVVGDFNGDGKQDLLGVTSSSLPIMTGASVFYGNGDGTLKPAEAQSLPPFGSFTTGDFNGDGVTDLALSLVAAPNSLYTSVQILLGSTSGTFTQGAVLPVVAVTGSAAGYSGPLQAVDLTGNGNLDLVVATSVLNIFHGDGKGNFAATGSYGFFSTGNPFLFADVNGDGKQDLILANPVAAFIFPGNGDSTFQAPPATPVAGLTADVNNDGIADMVFSLPQGGNTFGTALGRGDGTFAILDQTTALASPLPYSLMIGDFNGDGKVDTLAIQSGTLPVNALGCTAGTNSQVLTYLGSGDGRFQEKGTALALGVQDPGVGITGDFNSDGKLDLILPFGSGCQSGLLFVPGNGDGTFGAPVNLNPSQAFTTQNFLVGDLNNDKKLDFIWGNAVFLGNGDGTFKQIPLNIPTGRASAIADLNGDGILDAVSGVSIYAGNGDGTFQTTPFYSATAPAVGFLALGDVNGDGNLDLLLAGSSGGGANPYLTPYFGDGHGNFTADTNTYLISIGQSAEGATVPTRVNNQAPALPNDNRLDLLLTLSNGSSDQTYELALLNQTNPVPVKPAPITSTTALQALPVTAIPGEPIKLTASVFGTNPTGSVSFSAEGNLLGTGSLANGTAILETSFANIGTYAVAATYTGDSNNTASTSGVAPVAVMAAASTTTLQASPTAGDVNAQIALKASVTGDNPTGKVSFTAGSTSLGTTATLTAGVATLQTSFAAAGSYPVTAVYAGDQNNAASTSSAVTITIAAPDFTIATTPTSASVTPGQTATFTFTVSPVAGYSGTVKFSCGTLPSMAACAFTPSSVAPSGGSPVSSTLTVTTAGATAMLNMEKQSGPSLPPWIPTGGLAIAGAMGLAFAPRKIWRWNRQLRVLSLGLLLASLSLSLMSCGGGGSSAPSNPATPAGSYTLSVNASDSGGGPQHAISLTLSVQ